MNFHSQKMYRNRAELEGVSKSLLNREDPRTWPRYLVAVTAACLFSVATANSYWYHHHHFDTDVKNDMHATTHAERPVQMTRSLSNNGIVMNAKRYETLRHFGLGIDKNEHKTSKDSWGKAETKTN